VKAFGNPVTQSYVTLPDGRLVDDKGSLAGTPDQPQAPLELAFAGTLAADDAIRQEQRLKQCALESRIEDTVASAERTVLSDME